MEELSSVQHKEITNGNTYSGDKPALFLQARSGLQKLLRRVIIFIVYGPGVLGFLWLIGRILRR